MNKTVGFREADEKDIPLIQELIAKIWPKAYSHILTPAQTEYMMDMMYSNGSLQKQMNDGHYFTIATLDSIPVGFASREEKTDGRCRLHKIYVLPDSQGSGIGKKLVAHICALAAKEGCTTLELNVNRHNTAKSFYEKLGFHVVGEEDIDIGGGYFMNDYVMQLEL